MRCLRQLVLASLFTVAAAAAHAVTFTNVIITSPPLSNGSSFSTIGNSISFFTPNAIVGDPVDPLRAGTLNIQYDATSLAPAYANIVGVNLGAALLGSGMILFQEQIFELDINGNEVSGGPIGIINHTFTANSNPNWSGTIEFSRQVERFRAKKAFTLIATATEAVDLAAIQIINQNVQTVPEPATMAALGIGAAALLRRRRK